LQGIFISYRRSDSPDATGRIYDRLASHFGKETIFKDVDSIPLGADFRAHLNHVLSQCQAVLVIVGSQWTDARDGAGARRLDNPDDFVRIELEAALVRGVPVIPVLVANATMPREGHLPQSLAPFAYRQAIAVRPDPDFHRDMDRLVASLQAMLAPPNVAGNGDLPRIRHLRLVTGLPEVHASQPLEPDDPTGPSGGRGRAPIGTWGHLQLLEQVGEGPFGTVYRAYDPSLERDVAVKLLKRSESETSGPRILQEARTLARVRHPNVVTVHGAEEVEGRIGLTMELIRGRTLESVLAAQGPFGAVEAAVVGHEVCGALAAVHGAGLVHGDVKAANVMREVGGRLVLMDVGAGLLRQVVTASGPLVGTPLYLAPELLAGGAPTIATDIYAVGVLLFRMLAAEYPVMATSLEELRARHARREVRRLHDRRPDLDAAFVRVVDRALDPNPAQRYATAGELQSALAAVAGSTRSDARPLEASPAAAAAQGRAGSFRWTRIVPVLALALVLGATAFLVWRARTRAAPAIAAIRLLAVLPLTDLGGRDAYLADSITEALTQELAVAGPLRVVSRTSVARLINERTSVPDLARTLNADAIVEGSVQRLGPEVRIALRVIHAGTNTALWANTFERRSENILALQREIAKTVVGQLQLALSPETADKWQRAPAIDVAAYDNYLRGRYERRKNTQAAYQTALDYFRKSVATDPRYAPAYAAIAECYLRLGKDFGVLPLEEATREAKTAVSRALELDDTLSSAHAVQAVIAFELNWDFAAAEREYKRAIELDPSDVNSREEYSVFLASRGRFDDAYAQLSLAREIDPLSALLANTAAMVSYYARRYDDALSQLQRAVRLEPTLASAYVGLARVLTAMGRYDEAIAEASRANAMFSGHPYFEAEIAQAELGAGRVVDARRRIARLEAQESDASSRVGPNLLALAYARLDKDRAFAWLERSFQVKSGFLLWLKVDPRVDPLRSDPRFSTFLRRLQLVS
jgi:serine/threonine-protein kinase